MQITKKEENKVGRPKIDVESYFAKIKPFLWLGYEMHKACLLAEVPYRQLHEVYNDDEDFRNRVERERNKPNEQARANLIEAIKNKNIQVSQDWLERMEPDEFSKVQKVQDVGSQDEGWMLLREIITARRLKKAESKPQLPEPEDG